MDEVLVRRMTGAAVLFAGVFLLTALLPDKPEPGDSGQVVRYRLAPGDGGAARIDATEPAAAESGRTPTLRLAPSLKLDPAPDTAEPEPPTPEPEAETPEPVAEAAKPAPQAVAAAPPTSAPAPAAAGTPVETRWLVQVGSFGNLDNARSVRDALAQRELPVRLNPISVGGRTLHRVQVGPYTRESVALSMRDRLRTSGYPSARVFVDDGD